MAVLTTKEKDRLDKKLGHVGRDLVVGTRLSKLDSDGSYTGTITGTATNLDLGDTTPTAGSLDVFPAASGGALDKTTLTALTNGGNRGLGIVNRAMGQATALGIPDPGAAAGEFVLTNSAHQLIVNCNGADRTLALNGNVTAAGALDLGDHNLTINTSEATEVTLPASGTLCAKTGTPDATFTVDEGNATGTLILRNTPGGTNNSVTLQTTAPTGGNITLTLPNTSGTLAIASGAETGTSNSSFTVDNDSANAKIALNTNAATGNFTASLVPANLTGNRTITFSDAAGTVMLLDNGGSQTAAGDFVLTGTVDFQGNLTASAGNPAIDLSGSSGTFKTTTGTFTHYGNVANNGNVTWTWSSNGAWNMGGSAGTFTTPTGTNTLSGDVVVADGKQIDIGSATGGDATPLRIFSATAANGILVVKCTDDANNNTTTLQSGDPGAGANPTITLPIATCTLPGLGLANAWTGTADFQGNISASAGNPNVNFSASSGTFDSTTGVNQINGAGGVTINGATTPCVSCATGKTNTGYLEVLGKTSGGIKVTCADAAVATVTLSAAAQTDAQTVTIPDTAAAGKYVAFGDSAGNTAVANCAAAVQDLMPNITVTAGAEAAHARTITIQVRDAANNNLAQRCELRVRINATAEYNAPAATATDTFGAPSAGAIRRTIEAKSEYDVITDATGKYVFELTHNDAGTSRWIDAELDGRVYSSGELAFDAV